MEERITLMIKQGHVEEVVEDKLPLYHLRALH